MKSPLFSPYIQSLVSRPKMILLALLFLPVLTILGYSSALRSVARSVETNPSTTYLPVIQRSGALAPTADITISGGSYQFTHINIPTNVTVTVNGAVIMVVSGETHIAGRLQSDCTLIDLQGQGAVTITGAIDNRCSGSNDDAGDLILHNHNETLTLGTAVAPAQLHTHGNLDVSNAPDIPLWEFDVLPHQLSATPLPPACSAAASLVAAAGEAGSTWGVEFWGEGADPDGGPLTFAWAFGDGGTAVGPEPEHTYTTPGLYTVTLTVSDDEGSDCTATLQISLETAGVTFSGQPGVWGAPLDLVTPVGEPVQFAATAVALGDNVLTYEWTFGDSVSASGASPTHTYTTPGVYPITLSVASQNGATATATASLYVYEPVTAQLAITATNQTSCLGGGPGLFNVEYDGGQAADGRRGRKAIFRGRGNVFLGSTTNIKAQDGGNGRDMSGAGVVHGGPGKQGGSLDILVRGSLTLCGGAQISAGHGGRGGDATSITPAPGTAEAYGGQGGNAARRLRLSATQSLSFSSPTGAPIGLNPGNGGRGGNALAVGGDGAARCPVGEDGAMAFAFGGHGGAASKTVIISGVIGGAANAQTQGGQGGGGGAGDAHGGAGGAATCPTTATGGIAGIAVGVGGAGGNAHLSGQFAALGLAADAFKAGNGGAGSATGRQGGDAMATPSAACEATSATGGPGGIANAFGGNGGQGRLNGDGGNANSQGGRGGHATATGGDCTACNAGGAATAFGGVGGGVSAQHGTGATNGTATAVAGKGGNTTAQGGRGGDCDVCPAGAGGAGGAADAIGGSGGVAASSGTQTGGDGGDSSATGGDGGKGADCSCAKFAEEPGGPGGAGGAATSVGGFEGFPGGNPGNDTGRGGNGGDGGRGLPPGPGGPGGPGNGSPDPIPPGDPGNPGAACPPIVIWFIYHSVLPDGPIPPGSIFPLPTFPEPDPTLPSTGSVPLRFMEPTELGFPPEYVKSGDTLFVVGGLDYDLQALPPTFPVVGLDATLNHDCPIVGCIEIQGFTAGDLVATAVNQATGPGQTETIALPPPPPGVLYDRVTIVSASMFSFDHWGIIIIDP